MSLALANFSIILLQCKIEAATAIFDDLFFRPMTSISTSDHWEPDLHPTCHGQRIENALISVHMITRDNLRFDQLIIRFSACTLPPSRMPDGSVAHLKPAPVNWLSITQSPAENWVGDDAPIEIIDSASSEPWQISKQNHSILIALQAVAHCRIPPQIYFPLLPSQAASEHPLLPMPPNPTLKQTNYLRASSSTPCSWEVEKGK